MSATPQEVVEAIAESLRKVAEAHPDNPAALTIVKDETGIAMNAAKNRKSSLQSSGVADSQTQIKVQVEQRIQRLFEEVLGAL